MLHRSIGCPISGATGGCGVTEIRHHRIGMPHLTREGLSEGWLLRECGDAHWMAISRALRTPPSAMRDAAGNRLYAAFLAIRIAGEPLGDFGEDQQIETWHRLIDFSAPYAVSRTTVQRAGRACLVVEMSSVFVRREVEGCNRRIQRSLPVAIDSSVEGSAESREDRKAALMLRQVHKDLRRPRMHAVEPRLEHRLCAEADLNGAGFVYFAAFSDMMRRAECVARGGVPSLAATQPFERHLAFYGNAQAGETLRLDAGAPTTMPVFAAATSADGRILARSRLQHP
ncbi:MAG: Pnap_2097 family protein [Pseudomonadota bacterium]